MVFCMEKGNKPTIINGVRVYHHPMDALGNGEQPLGGKWAAYGMYAQEEKDWVKLKGPYTSERIRGPLEQSYNGVLDAITKCEGVARIRDEAGDLFLVFRPLEEILEKSAVACSRATVDVSHAHADNRGILVDQSLTQQLGTAINNPVNLKDLDKYGNVAVNMSFPYTIVPCKPKSE